MFKPMPKEEEELDRVEPYRPDFKGPVPPQHLSRPKQMLKPGPDHSQLGKYISDGGQKVTVRRCHACGAKWFEPAQTSTCTCSPKK